MKSVQSVTVPLLRCILGSLLVWAGFSKLQSLWLFSEALANYRLFPAQLNQALAITLPWLELGSGLLLLAGVWVRPSGWMAAGLFACFALASLSALLRGLNIECGCYGTASARRIDALTVLQSVLCLLGSIVLCATVRSTLTGKTNPKMSAQRSC
jgi:hypothetical protein